MIMYREGELAKSKSGHDKDKIYVIVREEREYVYLVDGKYRTIDKPKRKNKKHIQMIHNGDSVVGEKIRNHKLVDDVEIRAEIKKASKLLEL
ncbi:MAG: KOW domain-containing RNA-binding protein [Lachnospiraceae bacterium]|nr:KOW domain-containing RNA-binding protein [Lachnospiraceae bacterium]